MAGDFMARSATKHPQKEGQEGPLQTRTRDAYGRGMLLGDAVKMAGGADKELLLRNGH